MLGHYFRRYCREEDEDFAVDLDKSDRFDSDNEEFVYEEENGGSQGGSSEEAGYFDDEDGDDDESGILEDDEEDNGQEPYGDDDSQDLGERLHFLTLTRMKSRKKCIMTLLKMSMGIEYFIYRVRCN
jgi:hypothetical protein